MWTFYSKVSNELLLRGVERTEKVNRCGVSWRIGGSLARNARSFIYGIEQDGIVGALCVSIST